MRIRIRNAALKNHYIFKYSAVFFLLLIDILVFKSNTVKCHPFITTQCLFKASKLVFFFSNVESTSKSFEKKCKYHCENRKNC